MEKRELLLFRNKRGEVERAELEESDIPMLAKAIQMSQGLTAQAGKLLRMTEVEERVGLKKSAIYARIKEGTFPAPVKPHGVSSSRWRESDVDEWIAKAQR